MRGRSRCPALLLSLFLLSALLVRDSRAVPPAWNEARIRQLREESRKPGAPDSVKYQLALALATSGTIENRRQAFETFQSIHEAHENDPNFFMDVGKLLVDSRQDTKARDCFYRVIELRPNDVPARIEIARILLRETQWHFSRDTGNMVKALQDALSIEPDNRDALFLLAVAREISGGLDEKANPEMLNDGRECLQKILESHPDDSESRLLLAVIEVDLSRLDEADRHFHEALALAPAGVREAFASCQWTGPVGAARKASKMSDAQRDDYDRAYWQHHDPTPLSALNENQLEIWKRMVLADILFGSPSGNIHGWETDPGAVLVRFGPPPVHAFERGDVLGGPDVDDALPPAGMGNIWMFGLTLWVTPTSWHWNYDFRDLTLDFRFNDDLYNGRYRMNDRSRKNMEVLKKLAPVVFHDDPPGKIRNLYLASSGLAGRNGKVDQVVHLGLPLWRPDPGPWLDGVRLRFVVKDSTRTPVRQNEHKGDPSLVYQAFPGVNVLLVDDTWALDPGRYTVTAWVDDHDRHGVFTYPIVVRDYAPKELEISDLELALAADESRPGPRFSKLGRSYVPNPLCLVGDDRTIQVMYEIYGLAQEKGIARHEARYVVVPRQWMQDYEADVRDGKTRFEDLLKSIDEGTQSGRLDLGRGRFLDVSFPPAELKLDHGRGTKAVNVIVSDLLPGEYGLIVSIKDLISGATTSERTFFRILSPEEITELASYAQEK